MNTTEQHWLPNRRYLRWMMTQWCSYSCSYCQQNHDRKQVYKGSPGHWADNRNPSEWLNAFERHYSQYELTMHLTGGEPLLDKKNTKSFLDALTSYPFLRFVEVDTNGEATWVPRDMDKFGVHLSFHPEHVTEDKFLDTAKRMTNDGWRIMEVMLVVLPGESSRVHRFADRLRPMGIPLATSPIHGLGVEGQYTEQELTLFKRFVPDTWSLNSSPIGRLCLYPAVAHEMDPDGSLIVACHRTLGDKYHGSIWDQELPVLFPGYTSCPRETCACEERYSFLLELGIGSNVSPKVAYSDRLKVHQGL